MARTAAASKHGIVVSTQENAFALVGCAVKKTIIISELDEKQLDAANGVTGYGPAFAAMFCEALADGAVACGLPRQKALEYAAKMRKGSAELMLQEKMPQAVLKDQEF